uniref:Tail assembly protein n=1 Tax=Pseudomonas phage RVTF4 TaxID=3236931 RepID=A0AB39CD74_9VIRU
MSNLSFIQNLGLKLLGDALSTIKGDVVTLTRKTVEKENETKTLDAIVGTPRLERFFQNVLTDRSGPGATQIASALLSGIVGGNKVAYAITEAARTAEESGEGFMKKKAAVLRVIREVAPGLKKSQEQLAIELAVQLIKD